MPSRGCLDAEDALERVHGLLSAAVSRVEAVPVEELAAIAKKVHGGVHGDLLSWDGISAVRSRLIQAIKGEQ